MTLKAPFTYFGGKAIVAQEVWTRFGVTPNYVEPFAGSLAVLLARPDAHAWWSRQETVNDYDGLLSNFWRAVQATPDGVAQWADWPVNENDLHARHLWLVGQKDSLQTRLEGDPDYYDAKIAGWWVWGICAWIGNGWCSGKGPWQAVDRKLVHLGGGMGINRKLVHLGGGMGINRKLVHLGDSGMGINRKRVHLGGMGINRQLVHLGDSGMGINRQLVYLGDSGRGHTEAWSAHLQELMRALQARLRRVRVCCGDWTRVMGYSPTIRHGLTAVFLDPPYSGEERTPSLYTVDSGSVASEVREWAIANGDNPLLRIALCGYEGEHEMPATWDCFAWKALGGYGNVSNGRGKENAQRERIWFSPHCLKPDRPVQMQMFNLGAE